MCTNACCVVFGSTDHRMNFVFVHNVNDQIVLCKTFDGMRTCIYKRLADITFCSSIKCPYTYQLSGNTLRVSYYLCIRHTLGTVFGLHLYLS